MDDLALLKDMADQTPLPSAADLAPARARLTAAFHHADQPNHKDAQMTTDSSTTRAQRHDGRPAAPAGTTRRPRRRLLVSAGAVVGLAAAITGVVALGGLESVGVAPPTASAAEILHQAADSVRQQPGTPPRPDQFVYTKSQNPDGSVREAWLSADGTHDGLIAQQGEQIPLPGCKDGKMAVIKGTEPIPGSFDPCTPTPASLTDLPTDAAGMRDYLRTAGNPGDANSTNKNLFIVSENYVSPESLAALYEAVADFPGLTVEENATDGAGRPGVGVSWTYSGHTTTLVFDKDTHVFLGLSGGTAVVARGVVDTAGQQP